MNNNTFKIDTKDSEHYDDSGHIYRFDGFDCPICKSKSYWYLDDGFIDFFITALGCHTCGSVFIRSSSDYFDKDRDSGHTLPFSLYEEEYHLFPNDCFPVYLPKYTKDDWKYWRTITPLIYDYLGQWDFVTARSCGIVYP